MYGSSYVGATQWLAAETGPPHLVTIVPANTASDYYEGWTYENGAFRLNFIEQWAMEIAVSAAKSRGDAKVAEQLTQGLLSLRGCGMRHTAVSRRCTHAMVWLRHIFMTGSLTALTSVLAAMGATTVSPQDRHPGAAHRRLV